MDDLELLIDLHRGGTRQGPGGDDETRLAIELSGLRDATDLQLDEHWSDEYPEVATASTKTAALEQHGYSPIGYFALPEHCWLDNYYRPMQQRFADVSYGYYIARRAPD